MPERKRCIEEWLASSRRFLLSVIEAVRDEDWQRVAHDDKARWTARDVLAHVVGAEPSLLGIITRAQADLLAELDSNRVATLKLLADLPESALDFPVRHPSYGDMTVEDVFRLIGFHERLHADEIRNVTAS
jgi:hypothetical protein